MSIKKLTAYQVHQAYQKKELKPSEVVDAYIQNYNNNSVNAFVENFHEEAKHKAQELDSTIPTAPLWGIPGALKDNFSIKGRGLTCASSLLDNYVAPYDSSVAEQLQEQQFVNLGRLNMDEFAMGSTGRYSAHGPTLNPLDADRVAGGSSSGSAAVVSAHQALFAIGTDTGGSSRLPASYTGICGFKPTYGAISRYGLTALAPSFDVPGILAHTPQDIAMVYQSLLKQDSRDQIIRPVAFNWEKIGKQESIKGMKIALFDSLLSAADESVVKAYQMTKDLLTQAGAEFVHVDLGVEKYLIKTYYILMCSEAASTLSRFDGARYGNATKAADIESLVTLTRSEHLGHEVMRRILMGNYFLMSSNYDTWYMRALGIRAELVAKLNELSTEHGADVWLWPGFHEASMITAPEQDNYTSDTVAVSANLYGGPAIALPVTVGSNQLPVSVQLAGSIGSDESVLTLADFVYRNMNWRNLSY